MCQITRIKNICLLKSKNYIFNSVTVKVKNIQQQKIEGDT